MTVTFRIPGPLLSFTGGRHVVEADVPVATVQEALAQLWRLYPGLRDRILTEQGQVRPHVNVFVNSHVVERDKALQTSISDDSEICIMPAVSGG